MKKLIFAAVFMVFLAPWSAGAEESFKKGTWELGIESSPSSSALRPFIGYFINENVEGIFHLSYINVESDNPSSSSDDNSDALRLSAAFTYNMPLDTGLVPFVQGELIYINVETDGSSADLIGIAGGIGVRYMVGSRASINASLNLSALDIESGGVSADANAVALGLSYSLFIQ